MHKCHVFGCNDSMSRSIYQQAFKVLQRILLVSSHFLTASRSLFNVGSISPLLQPDLRIHDNLMMPLLFSHSSICEKYLTCAKNGTKLKSLFWVPSWVPGLSTRHDWPVKKAVVDVPIRLKGNSKRIFINSLGSLRAFRTP